MLNININEIDVKSVDAVLVPFFEGKLESKNKEIEAKIKRAEAKKIFKGAKSEVLVLDRTLEDGTVQDIIVLGLGKAEELTVDSMRKSFSKAVRELKAIKAKNVKVCLKNVELSNVADLVKGLVEGMILGDYKFDKFKTAKKDNSDMVINLPEELSVAKETLEESVILAEGTIIARDLVNEPANIMVPSLLADEAVKCGAKYGFEVEVKSLEEIKALGMEAFLSVAKGSIHEPKLIVMRYNGDSENLNKKQGLVGKGLTFDTGGYSIKPSTSMDTMKSDMGGSAAVIGAMSIIAERKLKKNVVAVVATCENAISDKAYKPGDIIGSMGGKNIEILNTDAEGRLTLIDAVHYIITKENVDSVVDIATLTGAVLVALGTSTTGVLANEDKFYAELQEASKSTGEDVWRLPITEEYKEMNKSKVADLKNIGGRFAGSITAGLFIGEFVQDKPWMHLDIAGTSWTDASLPYSDLGATGEGARILYELVKRR
ncbi:leucyl aminopeptidase [uncultured Clostridium sp.]|uniref:leucyl aminopeptidase n=1 Tax=uncultured Clostridium sp. TaxID=59620 RepID=UPI0026129151|nr:leucyl aminopeptidase [uncultured Clostridium sp.]